tara:strand:+ start:656 stop:1204 length:549 start_codon:yes stop_codon:yes gene_type:complete
MKNLVFAVLLITATSLSAQTFELTPTGFKAAENEYLVVDVSNKTAAELFLITKLYLTKTYKSSKDVMSLVDNKMITLNGYQPKSVRRTSMHRFDMSYNITIQFKDGKVRFDAPTFNLTAYNKHPQTLHLYWPKFSLDGSNLGIYGKKNKLKSKKAKQDLEDFFNGMIKQLTTDYKNESKDDW